MVTAYPITFKNHLILKLFGNVLNVDMNGKHQSIIERVKNQDVQDVKNLLVVWKDLQILAQHILN